jgi:parallel beta-helix repeat protein
MKYLKSISLLLVLFLLASCSGGGGGGSSSSSGGTSLVTITVGGGGQTASMTIEKNTLFAQAKMFFRGLMKTHEAVAAGIPSSVKKISFRISAPDMTAITRDVASWQDQVTETFTVPNGSRRHFEAFAYGDNDVLLYSGDKYEDIGGINITVIIEMKGVCGLYADVNKGSDTSGCRDSGSPCKSITYALTQTDGNETICVAKGFYTSADNAGEFKAILFVIVDSGSLGEGMLGYSFPAIQLDFNSTSITDVTADGNTATIKGIGTETRNGSVQTGCSFTATVTDGEPDAMGIEISCPDGSFDYNAPSQALLPGVEGGDFNVSAEGSDSSVIGQGSNRVGYETFPLVLKPGTTLLCQGADHTSIIKAGESDYWYWDTAIDVSSATGATIEGCRISGGIPAVYNDGADNVTIIDNIIEDTCEGIINDSGQSAVIRNNVFQNMWSSECNNVAIDIEDTGSLIDGNTITNNEEITGIEVSAVDVTITNNTITHNHTGIYVSDGNNVVINNNVLSCNNRGRDRANLINYSTYDINAQNNQWDNLPPNLGDSESCYWDDICILGAGSVDYTGASQAENPCRE